jgi:hypothetical protein
VNAASNIRWEFCKNSTEELLSNLVPLDEEVLVTLDGQNGIYIVAYEGNDLLFALTAADGHRPVYIGVSKFNSSRHFKSGYTGTSSLRRSLGALLVTDLGLKPVPRSQDPADKDRYNNYAFDPESEKKLTQWMYDNLRVAFLRTPPDQMDSVQKAMIDFNVPIFNFQNNPGNKYAAQIKLYRKKCAKQAFNNDKMKSENKK